MFYHMKISPKLGSPPVTSMAEAGTFLRPFHRCSNRVELGFSNLLDGIASCHIEEFGSLFEKTPEKTEIGGPTKNNAVVDQERAVSEDKLIDREDPDSLSPSKFWDRYLGRLSLNSKASDISARIPENIKERAILRHSIERRISQAFALSRAFELLFSFYLPKSRVNIRQKIRECVFASSHSSLKGQLLKAQGFILGSVRNLAKFPGILYNRMRTIQFRKRGSVSAALSLVEMTKVTISDDLCSVRDSLRAHTSLLCSEEIFRVKETERQMLGNADSIVDSLFKKRDTPADLNYDLGAAVPMRGALGVTRSEGLAASVLKEYNGFPIFSQEKQIIGYHNEGLRPSGTRCFFQKPIYCPSMYFAFSEEVVRSLPEGCADVEQQFVFTSGKCRIVTKSEPKAALFFQGLQRELFSSLRRDDHFIFTHSAFVANSIPSFMKRDLDGDFWFINGDLKSATDRFSQDWTRHVLKRILDNLLWPQLYDCASKYVCPSNLLTRLSGPKQIKNGQMMGNQLSFPILCIISGAIAMTALNQRKLSKSPFLVNGDDVSLRIEGSRLFAWHDTCRQLGLVVSTQKTMISENCISLNSHGVIVKGNGGVEDASSIKFPLLVNLRGEAHRHSIIRSEDKWSLTRDHSENNNTIMSIQGYRDVISRSVNPKDVLSLIARFYNQKSLNISFFGEKGNSFGWSPISGVPELLPFQRPELGLGMIKFPYGIGGLSFYSKEPQAYQDPAMNILGIPKREQGEKSHFDLLNSAAGIARWHLNLLYPQKAKAFTSMRLRASRTEEIIPSGIETIKTTLLDGVVESFVDSSPIPVSPSDSSEKESRVSDSVEASLVAPPIVRRSVFSLGPVVKGKRQVHLRGLITINCQEPGRSAPPFSTFLRKAIVSFALETKQTIPTRFRT
jgi:hypothetical protein